MGSSTAKMAIKTRATTLESDELHTENSLVLLRHDSDEFMEDGCSGLEDISGGVFGDSVPDQLLAKSRYGYGNFSING